MFIELILLFAALIVLLLFFAEQYKIPHLGLAGALILMCASFWGISENIQIASGQVELYNTVTTTIQNSTNTTNNTLPGVVGNYHFDDAIGTIANDSSPSSLDLTMTNQTWIPGKLGVTAMRFDGTTFGVDSGMASFERNQSFSIEYWFRSSNLNSSSMFVMGKYDTGNGHRGSEVEITSNSLGLGLVNNYSTGNYLDVAKTGLALNDGTWKHVVITSDGSSLASGIKIYLNGVQQSGLTVSHDALNATILTAQPFRVGKD